MAHETDPMRKFMKEFDLERYFENKNKAFFLAVEFDDRLHFASNMNLEELQYMLKRLTDMPIMKEALGTRVN